MAAAPSCFSGHPLLSASSAPGRRPQGGGRGAIRPSPASKALMPSDFDFQKPKTFDDLEIMSHCPRITHQKHLTNVHKSLHRQGKSGRETMATVDNLRRLCIDHYFEEEIESAMDACMHFLHSDDLLDATLAFRLTREAGHDLSADDILQRFTDGAGKFNLSVSRDIRGLLSLHDMSQLNMGEETLLYKAKEFSRKHLASAMRYCLEPGLSRYVRQSLDHPYHLSLMQYKARHHLSYLQSLPSRNIAMEELAIAEFQLNKLMHQKEMQEIKSRRWWIDLGLAQEIPVARDQVLKWYMWSMTILQGSSFSRYRVEATKIISFVYIVDDIFDIVGTIEELSLFTCAIKMWDISAADSLPSCMRSCYKALYTVTNEIADMAEKEHGLNPINHLRKAWARLFDGFMVEVKWLATDLVPAAEDYLRNGVVTSGMPLLFAHFFFLLGHDQAASHDAANLIDHIPPAISCSAKILRLWDDMGSAKDEGQDGLDGSYRDFYLMENPSCEPGDAEEHMLRLIEREWEELNRECFSRRSFSPSFTQACLNVARMVSVMYSYDKEQKLPVLEDYMKVLLL
ncbi:hypothetical protein ACP4OV_021835 [Aristida adscensionis]